jgi:hypothetical protein
MAPLPTAAAKLTGAAAWKALVGNSITGMTDDGPITQYYLPDGKVRQLVNSALTRGKWQLSGERVCFQFFAEADPPCYGVEVAGEIVTFLEDDGTTISYRLLPGNPRRL